MFCLKIRAFITSSTLMTFHTQQENVVDYSFGKKTGPL